MDNFTSDELMRKEALWMAIEFYKNDSINPDESVEAAEIFLTFLKGQAKPDA